MFGMNLDSVITILGVVAVVFTVLARTDAMEKKIERLDGKLERLASELRAEMAELRNDNKVLEGRIFLLAAGIEQPALTGADAVTNAVMAAPKDSPAQRGRFRPRR